jgi:hypothetical protein
MGGMMIRNISLAVAAVATGAFLALASPASATTYEFSYTAVDGSFSGQGDFITTFITGSQSSPFLVTDVTGFAENGNSLSAITGTSTYASADNLLFFPSTPSQAYTDISGISFSTVGAGDFNLYFNPGGDPLYPGFVGYGRISSSLDPSGTTAGTEVELSVSATPIPGALPLFATGLGVLGLFVWRRNRKSAVATQFV